MSYKMFAHYPQGVMLFGCTELNIILFLQLVIKATINVGEQTGVFTNV